MTSQTAGRMWRMPNAARAELANSPVREGARSPVNGNNDDKREASVTVRKHPFHLSLAIEAIHGERNTAPYTSAKAMTYAGWRRHLPNINRALAAARHTIWTSPAPSYDSRKKSIAMIPSMTTRKKARNKCHLFIEVVHHQKLYLHLS